MKWNKNIVRRLIQVFLTLAIEGAIIIISAGTLHWFRAWIFLAVGVLILLVNLLVLPAEVIEERGRSHKDAKTWDKIISALTIVPTLMMLVCCGLDFRFHWTGEVSAALPVAGLIFFFLASLLFTWAMVSNRFFSTLVRLQTERNHTVASKGPYRYVRHPGYLAYMAFTLATPVALGTLWGLMFALAIVILLLVRTALEDRTLKNELSGYSDYAQRVRFRLIPGLW
jgi:protein-S-isoprenylcysteine O-methyltransferase Ste14